MPEREQGYRLGQKALRQVAEVVRRVLREIRNDGTAPTYTSGSGQRNVTGATIGAITAATSALTGETTFTFALLRKNSSGDLVDSTIRLTGTNRDMTLTALDGTLVYCAWIDGEWRPFWVGCEPDSDLEALT